MASAAIRMRMSMSMSMRMHATSPSSVYRKRLERRRKKQNINATAAPAPAPAFAVRRAMSKDDFLRTVTLKIDEEFGRGNSSRMMENMKLSALRREQSALMRVTGNFDASDSANYVVYVAEEGTRIIGCVYMRSMSATDMDAMLSGAPSNSSRSPQGKAMLSKRSGMGSFLSAVFGRRGTPEARTRTGEKEREQQGSSTDTQRVGYISNLITIESERRRGVAAELMRSIREEAVRRDLARLYCHVNVDNVAAKRLYAKSAFVDIGLDSNAVDSAAASSAVPGREQRVLILVSDLPQAS